MIRTGLDRTTASYDGLSPPFAPAVAYPELSGLWRDSLEIGPANSAFAGVRAALFALGLDESHYDTPAWNPLGDLVAPGGSIVLKPNFIRHWNPLEEEGISCVITHGAILRAVADYAWIAAGRDGSVTLAEAPQMDCDWERIREIVGLDELVAAYAGIGLDFRCIDLRQESVRFEDGIVVSRSKLPGDPAGYRACELGEKSFFTGSGLDPRRMRGADYDPGPTCEHHGEGRNDYLLSETVLSADLVVNLPKIKTHKKTGVTLSQKNLVGINGDKNWLPHHCLGSHAEGGDEFPDSRWIDRLRSRATEWARPWLQRGRGVALFRLARRAEKAARGDDFIRAGNWHGNRTTWRMCLDLNRAFLYSNAEGLHLDANRPVRQALHVLDGIIAGENNGPLAPSAHPLGAVIAATDPVAADLVAVRLMGFDEDRLPILREAMLELSTPVTAVRRSDDVQVAVVEADGQGSTPSLRRLSQIDSDRPFTAHPGWRGRVEATLGVEKRATA
ncbi:MAG: DUF362 domain-containing protein [Myxococcota bacterium]|nr:DUF362 domain-containing protein [Myxococcota bacterium]